MRQAFAFKIQVKPGQSDSGVVARRYARGFAIPGKVRAPRGKDRWMLSVSSKSPRSRKRGPMKLEGNVGLITGGTAGCG